MLPVADDGRSTFLLPDGLCVVCVCMCAFVYVCSSQMVVEKNVCSLFVWEKKGNEFCSRMKFLSVEFFFCHQLKKKTRFHQKEMIDKTSISVGQSVALYSLKWVKVIFRHFRRFDTVATGNARDATTRSDGRDPNGTKIVSPVRFVGWHSDQFDEKKAKEQIIRSIDWRSSDRTVQQLIEVSQAMRLEDRWDAFRSFVRCRRFEANNPVACTYDE